MSGLAAEIRDEVKQFLDNPDNSVERSLSRATVLNVGRSAIEINQTKYIEQEDMSRLQGGGAAAVATSDWFNDVEWIDKLDDKRDRPNWRQLHLDATYPMKFFKKKPEAGSFRGKERLDQYGSIHGFGNKDKIDLWLLEFVDLDSRLVQSLRHPDDPTAIEQYNERYRQYLRTLDGSNPTISYHRGWDWFFRGKKDEPKKVVEGMSLSGLGLNEVVSLGSYVPSESENVTGINLHFEKPVGERVGRIIDITDEDEATAETFWTERRRVKRAGEDILKVALELVHDAVSKSANKERA